MATVTQHKHEHGFAFVSVSKLGKTQPTDRKTIRSHCMRGKNRTIGLDVRKRVPHCSGTPLSPSSSSSLSLRAGLAVCSPGSSPGSGFACSRPESHSRSSTLIEHSVPGLAYERSHDVTGHHLQLNHSSLGFDEEKSDHENAFTEPALRSLTRLYTPSTLSLLHLAFDVSNDDKAFLLDFLNAFTSTMYPTSVFTAYNIATCPWANWAFTDASYLQCIFFMASVLRDLSPAQYPTRPKRKFMTAQTYAALRKTIIHLNSRLSNPDSCIALADSTIAVVVILTMFCCIMGDHEGARVHVKGLKMLVSLRGGMNGFDGNEKLAIKLSRIDLVYALNTGTEGVFCTRPIQAAYAPGLPLQGPDSGLDFIDPSTAGGKIYDLLDSRLLPIFLEMQHYSHLINNAHVTRQRRTIEEYHSVVCSFQYRLLQMEGMLEDGLSECLRLTMLAFLITTFQFPGTRAQYPYLAGCLKRACCEVMRNEARACDISHIMGWAIIVGVISVFDIDVEEDWMNMMWKSHVEVNDWCSMRERLKSIIWVDVLQDAAGHLAFQQLNELGLR